MRLQAHTATREDRDATNSPLRRFAFPPYVTPTYVVLAHGEIVSREVVYES